MFSMATPSAVTAIPFSRVNSPSRITALRSVPRITSPGVVTDTDSL